MYPLFFGLLTLSSIFVVSSCTSAAQPVSSQRSVWAGEERTGFGPVTTLVEKLISVPLDPEHLNSGRFDLYYSARVPPKGRRAKTALFIAGGPGELVRVLTEKGNTLADFLYDNDEYNLVVFHLRGSGLSQVPSSNVFDRFLRTSDAVEDIEAIRKDFLGSDPGGIDKKWDAVIALSYGTILAQQYAHKYPSKIGKLVLIGPMSRDKFATSDGAYEEFNKDVYNIYRETLKKIFALDSQTKFSTLSPSVIMRAVDRLFGPKDMPGGIFKTIEDQFGNVQFVIDAYCDLKNLGETNSRIWPNGLDVYSREFFQALRDLRNVGWFPSDGRPPSAIDRQVKIGQVIKKELIDRIKGSYDCSRKSPPDSSQRAFYAIGTYDGINARFLKEWLGGGKKDLRTALRQSAGEAHVNWGVNEQIEKVLIEPEKAVEGKKNDPCFSREIARPWDPANCSHEVPTLILKGSVDPVSASGQGEYIFTKGLTGPRTLIEFPGIGHGFLLPEQPDDANSLNQVSGTFHLDPPELHPGEIRSVAGIVTGTLLNKKLQVNLPRPDDLDSDLILDGFGVVQSDDAVAGVSKNDVVVLLKNNKGSDVNYKGGIWTISNAFLTGPLSLDPVAIPSGQVVSLTGKLVNGKMNLDIKPPPEFEQAGFKFLCFKIADSDPTGATNISIAIKNDRPQPPPGQPGAVALREMTWTATVPDSKDISFIVSSGGDTIDPGKAKIVGAAIDGLNWGPDESMKLEPPEGFDSKLVPLCQAPGQDITDPLSVWIQNNGEDVSTAATGERWTLKNTFFTVPLTVDRRPIPGHGGVGTATAIIQGLDWNARLDIQPPTGLETGLKLVAFNISGETNLTALFKNTDKDHVIDGTNRSWIYGDPYKQGSCSGLGTLLDCLIYSFLVMDAEEFNNKEVNKIIDVLDRSFPGYKVIKNSCCGNSCKPIGQC